MENIIMVLKGWKVSFAGTSSGCQLRLPTCRLPLSDPAKKKFYLISTESYFVSFPKRCSEFFFLNNDDTIENVSRHWLNPSKLQLQSQECFFASKIAFYTIWKCSGIYSNILIIKYWFQQAHPPTKSNNKQMVLLYILNCFSKMAWRQIRTLKKEKRMSNWVQ